MNTFQTYASQSIIVKLTEREGQRVDLGGSLKGHLWMVDGGWWYTLMLYTKFGCHPPSTYFSKSPGLSELRVR